MNIKTLTAALATAALLAACGTTKTTAPAAGAKPSTLTQAADGTLIGPDGRTLYVFAKDVAGSGKSTCVDACAANWPPLGVAATAVGLLGRESDILRRVIWWSLGMLLVLCLLLYSISARDPLAPPQFFDGLLVAVLVAALAVDAVAMTAMASRIAEFGASPNKVVALGLNVLLLAQLAWSAVLGGGFCAGRRPFAQLCGWQTRFLPAYLIWAGFVVLVVPPVFGFA